MAKLQFTTICTVFLLGVAPSAADEAWQGAIGRVNSAGYKSRSHCSGTLIAPDLVLTAAHCVFARTGNRTTLRPEVLIFVAGWDRGDYVASSAASEIYVHPDFTNATQLTGAQAKTDMAVLRLSDPITAVSPLPISDQITGDTLSIAGYRGDRPHMLSIVTKCPRRGLGPVLSIGCEVIRGNSGGPVFEHRPDGVQIVGVVSMRSGQIALAAPVTASQIVKLTTD